MKKTIATFLLASAFATSLLFAQGPGNPPDPAAMIQRRIDRLTTLLGLTGDQPTQAKTIFTNAFTAGRTVGSDLRTARQSLRTAVQNNDTNAINQLSTTIGNLTAQMTSNEALAEAAFYHILTTDQQAKLAALRSQGPFRQ